MRLIILGDKSRYQFLRELIDNSIKNINLKTEILSEKDIEIKSEYKNINQTEEKKILVSKKIPLNTVLFFPSEVSTNNKFESNDKILFFDEFPYRTATGIENIKNILKKNPNVNFEIILIKNNRKSLQSDLSNEKEAFEKAFKEYNFEKFKIKKVTLENNYRFLFWDFKEVIQNTNIFMNDLKEIKKSINILFDVEYDFEYIQIDEKLSEQLLDSFVKYKDIRNDSTYSLRNITHLLKENVRMSKILCKLTDKSSKFSTLLFYLHKNFYTLENVLDYFFQNDYNYKHFFQFSENLYLKYIEKICIWDKERDLEKLKLEIRKRMEYFVSFPFSLEFLGNTEEDYIYFYNKNKKEMINFKNKIKTFFKKELCDLIKRYIENKIKKMEDLLNEKTI